VEAVEVVGMDEVVAEAVEGGEEKALAGGG